MNIGGQKEEGRVPSVVEIIGEIVVRIVVDHSRVLQ